MSEEYTDNHGYMLPERGSRNWDEPVNDNFRAIDRGVEIRDVEANRDDYTPREDAKFLATDTGVRYVGDGDEWVETPPAPGQVVTVDGEQVVVGGRVITGTVPVEAIEDADEIDLRDGDVYMRVSE